MYLSVNTDLFSQVVITYTTALQSSQIQLSLSANSTRTLAIVVMLLVPLSSFILFSALLRYLLNDSQSTPG